VQILKLHPQVNVTPKRSWAYEGQGQGV